MLENIKTVNVIKDGTLTTLNEEIDAVDFANPVYIEFIPFYSNNKLRCLVRESDIVSISFNPDK